MGREYLHLSVLVETREAVPVVFDERKREAVGGAGDGAGPDRVDQRLNRPTATKSPDATTSTGQKRDDAVLVRTLSCALLVAALAPGLARLVSSEIGAKPASGRGWALTALVFLLVYPAGRAVLHQRALAVLDARLYEGTAPIRVAAFPGPVNPFRWRGLVETSQFYAIFDLNLLREFDPSAGQLLYKPELGPQESAATEAARRTESFRVFLDFSQFPLWRYAPADAPEGAMRVEVVDLRFGVPPSPASAKPLARALASLEDPRGPAPFYLPCPACRGLMTRVNFARCSGVVIDVCPEDRKLTVPALLRFTPIAVFGAMAVLIGNYGLGVIETYGKLIILCYAAAALFILSIKWMSQVRSSRSKEWSARACRRARSINDSARLCGAT